VRIIALLFLFSCSTDKPTGDSAESTANTPASEDSAGTVLPTDSGTEPTTDSASPTDTSSTSAPEDTSAPGGDDPDDLDGDGFSADEDCDDSNPAVHPDAEEFCDGIDNNCNDEIDEELLILIYPDADGDGYGRTEDSLSGCHPAEGYAELDGDCDDEDPRFHPGADESDCADSSDYNCDGSVGYIDGDGDGFAACEECHDADPAIHPDADEICDHIDNDCDGLRDDADDDLDPSTRRTFYTDEDEDGFGREDLPVEACFVGETTASADLGFDCNDDDSSIHPGAEEICDEIDNDCDALSDDDDGDRVGGSAYYIDHDDDGYGSADYSISACVMPAGYVDNTDDCDDLNDAVNPEAEERCDGIDNNCDESTDGDDAIDPNTWYLDEDGDLYGVDSSTTESCDVPDGYAEHSGDCNDDESSIFPGADEPCDEIDNDCDGIIDGPDAAGTGFWYADTDEDGFGNPDALTMSCEAVPGHVDNNGDCDDAEPTIHPAADERCDEIDNNCDDSIDGDDAIDRPSWHPDLDGDGFGDPHASILSCVAPEDHEADATDCNDADPAIHPDAVERCDDIDNNCDDSIDGDDAIDPEIWFRDDDGDGEGRPDEPTSACDMPPGHVTNDIDCDDDHASAWSGGIEICDGIDNNCNGEFDEGFPSTTWYLDADGDFQGDPEHAVTACERPDGYVDNWADCNDDSIAVFSGAPELCFDGLDNDCDDASDCDDVDDCREVEATCWVCGDGYEDPGEECDDGDLDDGDGCSSTCTSEMDLSEVDTSWESDGRTVYVFKSNASDSLSTYNTYCEDRGLSWYEPTSTTDANKTIWDLYERDLHHTWIITKATTTHSPTWGGYSVTVDSPGCVTTSSSGFSAIRKWGCSMCDPELHGVTRCWDSDHSYDWLVCMN
jgi:cysteine-rich repeat protein